MPFVFSKTSRDRLQGAMPELQRLAALALTLIDCTILETNRSIEQQRLNVAKGVSKTMNSKHLTWPAQAMDIAPWYNAEPHIRWPDLTKLDSNAKLSVRWSYLIGAIAGAAAALGIAVRVGFDWSGDGDPWNESFPDWPHVELKGK